MKSFTTLILVTMTVAAAATGSVTLFDFSKTGATAWKELNDPVMGGKSTGTFTVANGVGVFDGEVVNVPALKAPGFIKAELSGSLFSPMHFPDVRHCSAIEIVATSTTAFAGYRFSFGSKNSLGCSFFSNGFKAHFDAPMTGGNAASVVIPFANFTDCNSDSTGKPIAGKTCADDTKYCPDQGTLQDMKEMAIWAEGAAGKVHLEIHSVNAVGCGTAAAASVATSVTAAGAGADVVLASFDGAKGTTRTWSEKNDPVMGGKSTGTFTIAGGVAVFDGDVVNVPFLKAPGFIKSETTDTDVPFPDISHCTALKITARAAGSYAGYRLSFGTAHPPGGKFFSFGYKAHFDAPTADATGAFRDVVIPFANFTDLWNDATGDPVTTCAQDKAYCPTAAVLRNVQTLSVWGEGVGGKVHLEIKAVAGTGCGAAGPAPLLAAFLHEPPVAGSGRQGKDTCSGPVEAGLRYHVGGRTVEPDLPIPLAADETVADAVCCDSAFAPFAEPRWYFNRTGIDLFGALAAGGVSEKKQVTFYDSVCGAPLFVVPRNRTLADFEAETTEHGWPSFREAELVPGAVKILPSGEVVSKCGTHLGSNLPDAKGNRYCLDLSCVSGNPSK